MCIKSLPHTSDITLQELMNLCPLFRDERGIFELRATDDHDYAILNYDVNVSGFRRSGKTIVFTGHLVNDPTHQVRKTWTGEVYKKRPVLDTKEYTFLAIPLKGDFTTELREFRDFVVADIERKALSASRGFYDLRGFAEMLYADDAVINDDVCERALEDKKLAALITRIT